MHIPCNYYFIALYAILGVYNKGLIVGDCTMMNNEHCDLMIV